MSCTRSLKLTGVISAIRQLGSNFGFVSSYQCFKCRGVIWEKLGNRKSFHYSNGSRRSLKIVIMEYSRLMEDSDGTTTCNISKTKTGCRFLPRKGIIQSSFWGRMRKWSCPEGFFMSNSLVWKDSTDMLFRKEQSRLSEFSNEAEIFSMCTQASYSRVLCLWPATVTVPLQRTPNTSVS